MYHGSPSLSTRSQLLWRPCWAVLHQETLPPTGRRDNYGKCYSCETKLPPLYHPAGSFFVFFLCAPWLLGKKYYVTENKRLLSCKSKEHWNAETLPVTSHGTTCLQKVTPKQHRIGTNKRHGDQWVEIENLDIGPHNFGHCFLDKDTKSVPWRKNRIFKKQCWKNQAPTCRRMKLGSNLPPSSMKINSK